MPMNRVRWPTKMRMPPERNIYAGLVKMQFKRPEEVVIGKTRNQLNTSVQRGQQAGRAAGSRRAKRKAGA